MNETQVDITAASDLAKNIDCTESNQLALVEAEGQMEQKQVIDDIEAKEDSKENTPLQNGCEATQQEVKSDRQSVKKSEIKEVVHQEEEEEEVEEKEAAANQRNENNQDEVNTFEMVDDQDEEDARDNALAAEDEEKNSDIIEDSRLNEDQLDENENENDIIEGGGEEEKVEEEEEVEDLDQQSQQEELNQEEEEEIIEEEHAQMIESLLEQKVQSTELNQFLRSSAPDADAACDDAQAEEEDEEEEQEQEEEEEEELEEAGAEEQEQEVEDHLDIGDDVDNLQAGMEVDLDGFEEGGDRYHNLHQENDDYMNLDYQIEEVLNKENMNQHLHQNHHHHHHTDLYPNLLEGENNNNNNNNNNSHHNGGEGLDDNGMGCGLDEQLAADGGSGGLPELAKAGSMNNNNNNNNMNEGMNGDDDDDDDNEEDNNNEDGKKKKSKKSKKERGVNTVKDNRFSKLANCHMCKRKNKYVYGCYKNWVPTSCNKFFCLDCLLNGLGENILLVVQKHETWKCPYKQGTCKCRHCLNRKEDFVIPPIGTEEVIKLFGEAPSKKFKANSSAANYYNGGSNGYANGGSPHGYGSQWGGGYKEDPSIIRGELKAKFKRLIDFNGQLIQKMHKLISTLTKQEIQFYNELIHENLSVLDSLASTLALSGFVREEDTVGGKLNN